MPLEKLEQKLNNVKGKNKYIYIYIYIPIYQSMHFEGYRTMGSTGVPYNLIWSTRWNAEEKTEKKPFVISSLNNLSNSSMGVWGARAFLFFFL